MDENYKFSVIIHWDVEPCEDIEGHSCIIEKQKPQLTPTVNRYGPIPNVLISEVMHELNESRKILLQTLVDDWKKRFEGDRL